MLIEINPHNMDQRIIQDAVNELKKGELIIFPTDSVYAIGCDLHSKKGLENLAKFKGIKPSKANFSIICDSLSGISNYVKQIERPVFKALKHNLPGPFTFILRATNETQKLFDSNRKELGIRIPDNPISQALVETLGNPIAVSSLHNEDDEIQDYFVDPYVIYEKFENQIDFIIDGGTGSLEASTVVSCVDGIEIIRQGYKELEL